MTTTFPRAPSGRCSSRGKRSASRGRVWFVHQVYSAVFHSGEAFGTLTFAVDEKGKLVRVRSRQNGFTIGEQFDQPTYKALDRDDLLTMIAPAN